MNVVLTENKNIFNKVLVLFFNKNLNILSKFFWQKSILERLVSSLKKQSFNGEKNNISTVVNNLPFESIICIGCGEKISSEILQQIIGWGIKKIKKLNYKEVFIPDFNIKNLQTINLLQESVMLGSYEFEKYKSKKEGGKLERINIIVEKVNSKLTDAFLKNKIISSSINFVRDLVNESPSILTPQKFSEYASELADKKIKIKILNRDEIKKIGMNCLYSVGLGSKAEPYFIEMKYLPKNPQKRVAIIGKGITFDSGGLSLKPTESMQTMKSDMAGAAIVLGLFKILKELELNYEVFGFIPLTENMPGEGALKPGDVIKAFNGKTIEVLNTDAEGRLILADALSYAVKNKSQLIIDFATLTGACIVALGDEIAGIMGNNKNLIHKLIEVGRQVNEKFWELPLEENYKELLKSEVADIKNISSKKSEAGAIIGGLFLKEFVDGLPWIHIDIAGPSWSDKERGIFCKGATGFGLKTLFNFLCGVI